VGHAVPAPQPSCSGSSCGSRSSARPKRNDKHPLSPPVLSLAAHARTSVCSPPDRRRLRSRSRSIDAPPGRAASIAQQPSPSTPRRRARSRSASGSDLAPTSAEAYLARRSDGPAIRARAHVLARLFWTAAPAGGAWTELCSPVSSGRTRTPSCLRVCLQNADAAVGVGRTGWIGPSPSPVVCPPETPRGSVKKNEVISICADGIHMVPFDRPTPPATFL